MVLYFVSETVSIWQALFKYSGQRTTTPYWHEIPANVLEYRQISVAQRKNDDWESRKERDKWAYRHETFVSRTILVRSVWILWGIIRSDRDCLNQTAYERATVPVNCFERQFLRSICDSLVSIALPPRRGDNLAGRFPTIAASPQGR